MVRAREGPKAARDRCCAGPRSYRAEYPFEVVQIDHTRFVQYHCRRFTKPGNPCRGRG